MRDLRSPLRVTLIGFTGLVLIACDSSGGGLNEGADTRGDVAGVYFSAKNGQVGDELWTSDGSEGGTRLLRNIAGSGADSEAGDFHRVGDLVLFGAETPAQGQELWRTDGSEAGTQLVKDILPGAGDGVDLSEAAVFNGQLYFAARDGATGKELWRSDGTSDGTRRVADIQAGANGSRPDGFTVFDGLLYFSAEGGAGGELWRSDGTAAGTERVTDINPSGGAFPTHLTVLGDQLLFFARDGSSGKELWRSDGDPASAASQVADIDSGADDATPGVACGPGFEPLVFQGAFYFNANDGNAGVELWRSDGSSVERITDINSSGDSLPCEPTVADGTLYFVAQDDQFNEDLYRLDTAAAATTVVQVNTGASGILPSALTALDGDVYFSARADGGAFNDELWRTNGLGSGITKVAEIRPGDDGSQPRGMIASGGTLYFGANDGVTGVELWRSDGTEGGTVRVKDINPSGDSDPTPLFATQ